MHILFAGGGTAGHINPALAVAEYIKDKDPDAVISYIGTAKKLEATLVPKAGYDFRTIDVAGFQRKLTAKNVVRNANAVIKAITSSLKAKKILIELNPDIVMGTGGYVSGPVLREAVKLGIPTVIHEQNAYPGVTTKMLASKVDRIMLAMPEAKDRLNTDKPMIVTGNPVRSSFIGCDKGKARKSLGIADDKIVVLSFGGSLGARPLNEAVAGMIAKLGEDERYVFIHSTGNSGYTAFCQELAAQSVKTGDNVRVLKYIDNMAECMSSADVVIGRAGAITLTEIEAAGRASVLIPSPYVAENHQFHNAMTLKKHNAAEVIEEKDLTSDKLTKTVVEITSQSARVEEMGKNAGDMAITDATKRIYEVICELINK